MTSTLAAEKQPVDWRTIDDALHDWVDGELGSIQDIRWANQNLPPPDYPFVTLLRSSVVREGGRADKRHNFDDARPVGEKIELVTANPVGFTLSIQALVDAEHGANDPGCNAVFLLGRLQASLSKQSVVDVFDAAGISVIEEQAVTDLSEVVNGEWISRALFDVRLRTVSEMTESGTYIGKVQIIGDVGVTELNFNRTFDSES